MDRVSQWGLRTSRPKGYWVWVGLLTAAATVLGALTVATFSPGFMSYDTLFQLKQAEGTEPLSDWHPPIMSLLWRALIAVTGTYATMAALQLAAMWAALLAIAVSVFEVTGSKGWSVAFLSVGVMPHVLNIAGVVWKDVQMAQALLGVVAVCLLGLASRRSSGLRWVLMPLGVALLAYALLVRKNGIVAVLPMLYLLYRCWFQPRQVKALALALVGFVAAAVLAQGAITLAAAPEPTYQLAQMAIDDVINVVPRKDLLKESLSPGFRDKLLAAQKLCQEKESLSNSYWTCYGRGAEGPFTPIADHEELTKAWPRLMLARPAAYLQYRAQVFSKFLFLNRDYWQEGVLANDMGIAVDHPRMVATLRSYVLDFAYRNVLFLFGAWFWLMVGAVQSLRWRCRSLFHPIVPCLGVSSLLYLLAYFPTVPATDFRYAYWPAIAGTLGLLVMGLERWLGSRGRVPVTPTAESTPDPVPASNARPEPQVRGAGRVARTDVEGAG